MSFVDDTAHHLSEGWSVSFGIFVVDLAGGCIAYGGALDEVDLG